jgi:type I restriction-modification system DNA methylase subunit
VTDLGRASLTPDSESITRRTIDILNSVDYSKYGHCKNYDEYALQSHADERKLIQPILFRKFLEQILGFSVGNTIWPEQTEEGNTPDFLPVDTYTHPFLFDTKSTAVTEQTIKKHAPQIRRYIRLCRVGFGVLTNMRELDVYTEASGDELPEFDFSFLALYRDFRTNRKTVSSKENTQKFLHFVATFSYKELDVEKKIERICKSAGWTGNETLNINHLTLKLKQVVEWFEQDALNQKQILAQFSDDNPDLAREVVRELDSICKEIDTSLADAQLSITPQRLAEYLAAPTKTSQARALRIYFYRIAYFSMARVLLARMWEDIGFIESTLADGGFGRWYKNLGKEIRRVLNQAFQFASEKYQWLYRTSNNYTWYEPSETVLVDALYELANFYLGALKDDALGMIYEQELDIIDKQNKGQYYTDRAVIRFMWDRVGFNRASAFFREDGKKREPKKILDVAAGSGGFLVEAARRVRELAFPHHKSFEDVELTRRFILFGLFGMEISPFPYYITEINLLIQLTPLIREMSQRRRAIIKEGTPIGVIQGDSLTLYNEASELFVKEEVGKYPVNNNIIRFGRDTAKQRIFDKMYSSSDFDYCLANPPYIREDDHKELFRRTKQLPVGREFYQGKMDYYHFFVELGLSKLREGGKLCFITTSYWLQAVGASNLRRYILNNCLVREVIHFGPAKLFESARGQFNVIFLLEKKSGQIGAEARKKNAIKVVQVKQLFSNNIQENIQKLFRHLSEHVKQEEYSDKYIDVYESATRQEELTEEDWDIFVLKRHKKQLELIKKVGMPLEELCTINQGLVSGADRVTSENIGLLTHAVMEEHGIKEGDGIFYITEDEIQKRLRPTSKDIELVKRLYKTSEITSYLPSNEMDSSLKCLYVTKDTAVKDYPRVYLHLQKYRNILERKREFQEGKLPWYSMHWARSKDIFEGEKISVSIWPPSNIFGYSESDFYAERNIFIIKKKARTKESLKYILGVLNSSLMTFYFEQKGSRRGDKYFFPKEFCQKLPIKPIETKAEQKVHDEIVSLVDEMIEDRNKLLDLSRYVGDPQFINKKYFDDQLPELNDKAIVNGLGWKGARPLNRSAGISYSLDNMDPQQFTLMKVQTIGETLFESKSTLRLVGADGTVVEIKGAKPAMDLLKTMLEQYKQRSLKEILESVELPIDMNLLERKRRELSEKIRTTAKIITDLQKGIDKLVLKLYGVDSL